MSDHQGELKDGLVVIGVQLAVDVIASLRAILEAGAPNPDLAEEIVTLHNALVSDVNASGQWHLQLKER